MLKIIKKPVAEGNYRKGRRGQPVRAISIHIMDGTLLGTDAWFNDPDSNVSSHYGIGKSGEIHQYVAEQDTAATQGIVDHPSSALVKRMLPVNPNNYFVSIELEGRDGDHLTDAQKTSTVALIADIARRNKIALTVEYVLPHHAIRRSKTCPGPGVDVNELIRLAIAHQQETPNG
jgi:N-acetylmuramoyl-L-alanine amidase